MRKRRVHWADGEPGETPRSLCRLVGVDLTDDRGRLTCRVCTRLLKERERREVRDSYASNERYIAETQFPLSPRITTRLRRTLWTEAYSGIADAVRPCTCEPGAGIRREDGLPAPPLCPVHAVIGTQRSSPRALGAVREKRTTPYASARQALVDLHRVRADGYEHPSLSDPDRMARLMETLSGGSGPKGQPPRVTQTAEQIAEIERCLADVYVRPPGGHPELTPAICRVVLFAKAALGLSREDIAAQLTDRLGTPVSAWAVGRVARTGERLLERLLAARELVPQPEGPGEAEDHQEDDMTKYDLSGWDGIARFLGCSQTTAQRYARELGMPVYTRGRSVCAVGSEVRAWNDARVAPLGAAAKSGSPPPLISASAEGLATRAKTG